MDRGTTELEEALIMIDSSGDDDEDLAIDPSPGRQRRSKRKILQAIFLLLGVGILVPWNAFISAKQYFQSRLCAHDADTNTYVSSVSNIESVFAMLYNFASVLSLGLVITIQAMRDQVVAAEHSAQSSSTGGGVDDDEYTTNEQNRITILEGDAVLQDGNGTRASAHKTHAFLLVMAPLSIYLVTFLGQSGMVFIVRTPIFEQFTIISLVVCGMASVIAQSGIVATAGLFDSDLAMNPYLVGQSLGGVAVSLANFIAACWEDPHDFQRTFCADESQKRDLLLTRDLFDEQQSSTCSPYGKIDWATFLYFFLGSMLLLACLFGYSYVDRFRQTEHRDMYETVHSLGEDSIDGTHRAGFELHQSASKEEEIGDVNDGFLHAAQPPHVQPTHPADELDGLFRSDSINDPAVNETAVVWMHIRKPATAIFLTFFVTLGLFPGWAAELRSVRRCQTEFRLANDLYVPFMFLFFNLGDLTGRLLSARLPTVQIQDLSTKLVAAACVRFLFFPLLFLCTGGSDPDRLQIRSDFYSETVQFAFAVSNGFVLSTAFVHAPSLVPHTSDMQERCSEILNFSVAFGLLSGSFISFPVAKLANI